MGEGDPVGMGYTEVEVVGVCNWVVHEGGPDGAKPKNQASRAQFW